MRLDKYLSNLKYGTRKEVTKVIKKGFVKVNDEVVKSGTYQVKEDDVVLFYDEQVYYNDSLILMVNKPKGYVSANKDNLHKTVLDLIEEPYNRFDLNIAGRLDIDTEGLVLLTNDGKLLHNIISPNKDVYKKYYVEVDKKLNLSKFDKPFEIKDAKDHLYTPALPKYEEINDTSFYLLIKEGKFHQVKRMCEHFGSNVTYLKRVGIGDLELGDLELGQYKEIKNDYFE